MKINFRKTEFWGVSADVSMCPPSDMPEIVVSGKSNVGKSSLVNALSDNRKLARVSSSPGKTRLVIYFNVDNKIYLADLPGYGYAKAPQNVRVKYAELVDRYFASGRPIALILHLIDIRHAPSVEDIQMIAYMNEHNLPYFTIFTKTDKLSRAQLKARIHELSDVMQFDDTAQCFAVSSEKKQGLEDLQKAIEDFIFPDN